MDDSSCSSVSINSWISCDSNDETPQIAVVADCFCEETKDGDLQLYKASRLEHQESLPIRSTIDTIDGEAVEVSLDISFLSTDKSVYMSNPTPTNRERSSRSRDIGYIPRSSEQQSSHPRLMNALFKDEMTREVNTSTILDGGDQSSIRKPCAASPSTAKPLSFCGVQEWCEVDTGCTGNVEEETSYECAIEKSLGSPVDVHDWCQGWQTWSVIQEPTLLEYDHLNSGQAHVPPGKSTDLSWKHHVQRSLRSRAYGVTMRKRRLDLMKQNMNPFDAESDWKCKLEERITFGKARSFNRMSGDNSGIASINPKTDKGNRAMTLVSVLECGSLNCSSSFQGETPAAIRKACEEECIKKGYDSDPEDFTRKSHRYSPTNKENKRVGLVKKISSVQSSSILVQEFMNEKITLLLHRDCIKVAGSKPSFAVHAWIERGQRLNNQIILPKLVWMPVNVARQKVNWVKNQRQETMSIELLDINRVLELSKIDRNRYPFARLSNTFLLRTMQEEYIFEASSAEDRFRLVQSLKHVVARFASIVLLQDDKAIMEFFSPRSTGPGEQPHWLSSSHATMPIGK